jgi:hypothetical protein
MAGPGDGSETHALTTVVQAIALCVWETHKCGKPLTVGAFGELKSSRYGGGAVNCSRNGCGPEYYILLGKRFLLSSNVLVNSYLAIVRDSLSAFLEHPRFNNSRCNGLPPRSTLHVTLGLLKVFQRSATLFLLNPQPRHEHGHRRPLKWQTRTKATQYWART